MAEFTEKRPQEGRWLQYTVSGGGDYAHLMQRYNFDSPPRHIYNVTNLSLETVHKRLIVVVNLFELIFDDDFDESEHVCEESSASNLT